MARPFSTPRPIPARTTRRAIRFSVCGTAVALAVAGLVTACGSSSSPAPAASSATSSAAASAKPSTQLFADDFLGTCHGATVSRATAYAPSAPAHKMVLFTPYSGDLVEDTSTLPNDWMVQFDANSDAYAKIDLVACLAVKNEQPLKECANYQDNNKPTGNKVEVHSATYTLTVHAATTGALLGTTQLPGADDSCPMFMTFDSDTQVKNYDEPPSTDAVVAFLKPFAQP